MVRGRRFCWCLWAVCLILGGSTAGLSADWIVTPGIELKGEYLSNINNGPRNVQSDYIASARPNLSLSYNTERTQFQGTIALLGMHYFHKSELDRINQYYNFLASHKLTPRLGLNLGTAFITDSTANEELQASGTLINRQTRTSFAANPGLSYFLTERWSTSLSYGFNLVDYQAREGRNYNNYEGHSLTHGFDYILNEKTTLLSRLTASFYKYSNNNTTAALGPQLGFNYKYLEKWDLMFLGGLNINRVKSDTRVLAANTFTGFLELRQQPQTSSSVSPFITLGANYRWQTGSLGLNYVSSQSANAYGNQSLYNNFNLNIKQTLTERLDFSVNPYVYTSTITNPGSDYNSVYYGIRPGLIYKLTEKATVGAYYAFSYRTVSGTNGYSYPVNDVWLTFNYATPIHY